MASTYFSVPIFFVLFREATEAAIIVSVLLSFLTSAVTSDSLRRKYTRRIWLGMGLGLLLSLGVGAIFLVLWYKYATNLWVKTEALWEGIFGIIGCVFVTITAISMLKANHLVEKYKRKFMSAAINVNGIESPSTAPLVAVSRHPLFPKTTDESERNESPLPTAISVKPSTTTLLEKEDERDLDSQMTDALSAPPSPIDGPVSSEELEKTPLAESGSNSGSLSSGASTQYNTIPTAAPNEVDFDTASEEDLLQGNKTLFWLPFVTVLREGLESVVFLGGLAIAEPPSSIPLAAIVGVLCGFGIGYFMHAGGSRLTLHWFFVGSTYVLLLIAAGLLTRSVGLLEDYTWSTIIGAEADDAGYFYPWTNVWHLQCCSPEDPHHGGWAIFNALLGWRNNASVSTILSYCGYWVFVSIALVIYKKYTVMKKARSAA